MSNLLCVGQDNLYVSSSGAIRRFRFCRANSDCLEDSYQTHRANQTLEGITLWMHCRGRAPLEAAQSGVLYARLSYLDFKLDEVRLITKEAVLIQQSKINNQMPGF